MSFAADIKDFINSATGVYDAVGKAQSRQAQQRYTDMQTRKMEADLNDPLKEKKAQADIDLVQSSTSLNRRRANLMDLRAKALQAQPQAPAIDVPNVAPVQPSVGPAIPTDQPVQAYAEGGIVGDEDDDPDDEDDVATDFSSRSRLPPQVIDDAHEAAIAGLQTTHAAHGMNQPAAVMTPARQRSIQAYLNGAGGATPEEFAAVAKKVDPEGKLTPTERSIASLGALWRFKMARNDLAGARATAAAIMQHYRVHSTRYAQLAAVAAQNGDMKTAAKAAMSAYSSVPDGKDLTIVPMEDGKLRYKWTDLKTGKTVEAGVQTPQEFTARVMGFANGNGFDQMLLQAAGERHAAKGAIGGGGNTASKGEKALTTRDLKSMRDEIDTLIDSDFEQRKKDGKSVTDSEASALKNGAFHIAQENRGLAPNEAYEAAKAIIAAPDGSFKAKRSEESGRNVISFGDSGREISLSDAELRPLMVLRGKALKERKDQESKPKEKTWDDVGSDLLNTQAAKAVGTIGRSWGGAVGDAAGAAAEGVKQAIPAIGGAIRRGVGEYAPALDSSIRNGLDNVGNKGQPGVDQPL